MNKTTLWSTSITILLLILILFNVTHASFLVYHLKLTAQSPQVGPYPSPTSNSKEEKSKGIIGGDHERCDGIDLRCHDTTHSLVACLAGVFDHESKVLVLILNEGDNSLKVDLTVLPGNLKRVFDIPHHQSKKVNISLAKGGSSNINLNAGHGDCVLHPGSPTSQGNYFQRLPSYSKFMTPVYGAYLVLLITVIAGLVWACCWFRKRKGQTDIPYQELEMSMPAETADAWDQDWDDDWDEERAVKSPVGQKISANGLTSRTQNRDDREDWAD